MVTDDDRDTMTPAEEIHVGTRQDGKVFVSVHPSDTDTIRGRAVERVAFVFPVDMVPWLVTALLRELSGKARAAVVDELRSFEDGWPR
jgi:hypothetical protein